MAEEATQAQVVAFLQAVRPLTVWIDGGWGVDALLGRQTRPHADLDVVIDCRDLAELDAGLAAHGYRRAGRRDGHVFVSGTGLEVDVHAVGFDPRGYGCFALPEGDEWPFPPSAFTGVGVIGGVAVRCLSAEAQVHCHAQGYQPQARDLADMAALQRTFGVVLPLALCPAAPETAAASSDSPPRIRAQYHLRRTAQGIDAFDVRRLIRLSADLPVRMIDPLTLAELDEDHWYFHTGRRPTPRGILEHLTLILGCDLDAPIVLDRNGRVMDGMHRVCKAVLERVGRIPAVQFEQDPAPDRVDCRPEDLPYDSDG